MISVDVHLKYIHAYFLLKMKMSFYDSFTERGECKSCQFEMLLAERYAYDGDTK